MKKRYLSLICWAVLLVQSEVSVAEGEYLIVKGKILSQVGLPADIQPSDCYEENKLCMNTYYRFEIDANDSLDSEVNKTLTGVQYLHGNFYSGSEDYLFVLKPITDEDSKKLLQADYFILERVVQKSEYCLSRNLSEYVKEDNSPEDLNRNCISTNDTFSGLKQDLVSEVILNVEVSLEKEEGLIELNYFSLDANGALYSGDEVPSGACTEEDIRSYDMERQNLCNSLFIKTEMVEFIAKEGLSTKVIMEIKRELARLPFKLQKSEFVDKSTDRSDIVHWYYEIE